MNNLVARWRRYWFHPAPVFNLALCRIAIVGFQLWYWWRLNTELFGDLSRLPASTYAPLHILTLLTWPFGLDFRPSLELVMAAYWVTLAAGILSLIGIKTNLTLLVFAVGSIFLQSFIYSFSDYHHPEALMMIALLILALSPAGRALSVDAVLRRLRASSQERQFRDDNSIDEKHAFAAWPLLLIQWMLALAYFDSAVSKLGMGGSERIGLDWANGYTLQYHLLNEGLLYGSDSAMWLGQQHLLVVALSWTSLLFEASFFLIVLFPLLALIYIPFGIAFHTGIYVTLNAPFFQWMVLYSVFIPWVPLLRATAARLPLRESLRRPELRFDATCAACVRTATFVRYFDWFGRLDYSGHSNASPHGVHLTSDDGPELLSPASFRHILRQLPPLWPVLAASYLPGVSALGARVMERLGPRESRYHSYVDESGQIQVELRGHGSLSARAAESSDDGDLPAPRLRVGKT